MRSSFTHDIIPICRSPCWYVRVRRIRVEHHVQAFAQITSQEAEHQYAFPLQQVLATMAIGIQRAN